MIKRWKKIPKWLRLFAMVVAVLVLLEIVLRLVFGLGDLPVYREDEAYEYFYAPDQDVWRYGNHIVTNELGMRSKPVNKKKKTTILLFGDSVLNGGAHVDQEDLATTLLENSMGNKFDDEVQVLNISAQSWGPSNAFAFLKKHGDFNADIIVLVFSSHDWNDNMHFKKVVGNHPAWPDSKPFLAITDAWSRLVWPNVKRIFTGEQEYEYLADFDDAKANPGWKKFAEYCKKNQTGLVVYLHASQTEIKAGNYNKRGKEIEKFCRKNSIRLIKDISSFDDPEAVFKDDIHLLGEGHRVMASLLYPELFKVVGQKYSRGAD